MKQTALVSLLIMAAAVALQGCTAAAVGAGAAAGASVAYDRRTTGTIIDDQTIEFKALDALFQDKELWNQCHINVTSFNNVVLLTGEAPTEALRERAVSMVRGIPKVRQVYDEITISAPSAMLSRSSDTWITSKVKSMLLADGQAPGARVKVVTEKGVVYLMGLVTRAEGDAATEVARQVSGVQRVVKLFEYLAS